MLEKLLMFMRNSEALAGSVLYREDSLYEKLQDLIEKHNMENSVFEPLLSRRSGKITSPIP